MATLFKMAALNMDLILRHWSSLLVYCKYKLPLVLEKMSSHISTLNDVLNLRYRPHYSKYKDLYYTQQNH